MCSRPPWPLPYSLLIFELKLCVFELKTQRDETQGLPGGTLCQACPSSRTPGAISRRVPISVPRDSFLSPLCFSFTPIFLHLFWREQAVTGRHWPSGCWGGVLTSWERAAPHSWTEEPSSQTWRLTLLIDSCRGPSTLPFPSLCLSGPNQTPLSGGWFLAARSITGIWPHSQTWEKGQEASEHGWEEVRENSWAQEG